MNRLSDPSPADTLSQAALSPCSNGSVSKPGQAKASRDQAGSESAPPLEAPADLPLVGLQKTLAEFSGPALGLVQTLADVHFRKPQDPISLCHWLDWIRERADEAASHAMALHQMTDILWDRASAECARRYQAIADESERAAQQRGAVRHERGRVDSAGADRPAGVGGGRDAGAGESERVPVDEREPEPFRDPQPCSVCGGHGGSVSDGTCGVCEGTGIDPDDPAFPI